LEARGTAGAGLAPAVAAVGIDEVPGPVELTAF
jgi:hypothetical protein